MKQAETKRGTLRIRRVTEEPPITRYHTVEILLLNPASPFAGMTGLRPVP